MDSWTTLTSIFQPRIRIINAGCKWFLTLDFFHLAGISTNQGGRHVSLAFYYRGSSGHSGDRGVDAELCGSNPFRGTSRHPSRSRTGWPDRESRAVLLL